MTTDASAAPIRLGISACLLGREVRFDGGHKRDRFLTDTFGRFVEWVPVCPEVEAGFGTPREAMRLVHHPSGSRLVTVKSGIDLTSRFDAYARRRVDELVDENLSGYVLKKDSPSCGLERVKVYRDRGVGERSGRGLFAERLHTVLPSLPLEEEGRLSDPHLRENFVERVFAYRQLRECFKPRWTMGALVKFHTVHKLTLMAHSPLAYRTLGRLVAAATSQSRAEVESHYRRGFMAALAVVATTRRHVNVLQHMAGFFKKSLDSASRAELAATIDEYGQGLVPLIVPLTLIRHHVRRQGVNYLAEQTYLEPHPRELMLRNHV